MRKTQLIQTLAVIMLTLGLASGLSVGWFEDGSAEYQAGNYQKAAEQGDASAQFNLGLIYRKGKGVTQDYKEAIKWFRKAAEQGDAEAQFNLGLIYRKGKGVTQDYKEAIKWFRKAAEQGDAEAQFNLCLLYTSPSPRD